jgi:cytochrome bd-type quinol oxidase subunit 2
MTKTSKKKIYGVLTGLVVYTIIGLLGLYLLRISWAGYAIASKDKSYTVEMLLCRLLVALVAAVIAGISTVKITNDKGKTAWLVGAILFCVAAYIHLCTMTWKDYPVWYHVAYLLPIIPVTGLSHYFTRKTTNR